VLAEESPPSGISGECAPQASHEVDSQDDLADQIERLRDDNAALVAALCGLCVGISQISEVHRAIVAQAFDYADRFAATGLRETFETGNARSRAKLIDDIRSAVLRQHRDLDPRY
jgi:hypothetical protein